MNFIAQLKVKSGNTVKSLTIFCSITHPFSSPVRRDVFSPQPPQRLCSLPVYLHLSSCPWNYKMEHFRVIFTECTLYRMSPSVLQMKQRALSTYLRAFSFLFYLKLFFFFKSSVYSLFVVLTCFSGLSWNDSTMVHHIHLEGISTDFLNFHMKSVLRKGLTYGKH